MAKAKVQDYDNDYVYDFFMEKKWLMFIACQTILGKTKFWATLNWIFIGLTWSFLIMYMVLTGGAIIVSLNDKNGMLLACHTLFLCVGIISVVLIRIIFNKSFNKTSKIIQEGIFHYEEEDSDEELIKIKEKGIAFLRKRTNNIVILLYFGSFFDYVVTPGIKVLKADEDMSAKTINPYLPLPAYMPFDTTSIPGFCLAYFIEAVYGFYLTTIITALNEIYMACTVQLKIQLEILNYSLRNIEKRAYLKLLTLYNITAPYSEERVKQAYTTFDYNRCLYACLRENIRHHQTLIRYRNLIHPFNGASLLAVFLLASLTLAMAVILLLENPDITRASDFLIILTAEVIFIFSFCLYGEQVMQESNKVFQTLFATPWPKCDKQFAILLHVMMSNSINPITLTASIFNITASVESFGNIVSTMYQIVNVVRNT